MEEITIVGAGLLGTAHLGRAAEDAIRAARVVFYSSYNAGMADHVRRLNATAAVRLSEENEYRLGMYRPDMYRRMADAVIAEAREGPGVVVLAPGSGLVVDLVTQLVFDGARAAGLGVRALPGISSIEAVLAEVEYDAAAGLEVLLAQKLVLHGRELDPTIASIVLQPAYFDTLHYLGAPISRAGRFDALAAQIGRTLGPDAPMALVITPTVPGDAASVFWLRLAELGRLHAVLSPRHTLFVPPERPAPIDGAFAARVESWQTCLGHVDVDAGGTIAQQKRREIHAGRLDLPADLRAESELLAARWRARRR
jgi:precorrin-6B methylase 1